MKTRSKGRRGKKEERGGEEIQSREKERTEEEVRRQ